MQHTEVINALASMEDELRTSEPTTVLRKYAKDRNLSPDVLVKMAQVYNITLTSNVQESSNDRGSSFELIDTNALSKEYIENDMLLGAPLHKVAHAKPTHNPDEVNLSGMFFGATKEVTKAASKVEDEPSYTAEEYRAVAEEQYYAEIAEAEKCASDIVRVLSETADVTGDRDTLDLRTIEGDLQQHFNVDAVDSTINYISKVANAHYDTVRLEKGTVIKRAFATTVSPLFDVAKELTEHLAMVAVCKAAAIGPFDEKPVAIPGIQFGAAKEPEEVAVEEGGVAVKEREEKDSTDTDEAPKKETDSSNDDSDSKDKPKDDRKGEKAETKSKEKAEEPFEDKTNGGNLQERKMETSESYLGSDALRGGKRLLGSAVDSVTDAAGSAALAVPTALGEALSRTRINSAQQEADTAAADIRRAVMLRRLTSKDPVLAEMDKDRVASLYNSIATANPALAKDPNLLLHALREAASYDGVPVETLKQLQDARKSELSNNQAEANEAERQYTI